MNKEVRKFIYGILVMALGVYCLETIGSSNAVFALLEFVGGFIILMIGLNNVHKTL